MLCILSWPSACSNTSPDLSGRCVYSEESHAFSDRVPVRGGAAVEKETFGTLVSSADVLPFPYPNIPICCFRVLMPPYDSTLLDTARYIGMCEPGTR